VIVDGRTPVILSKSGAGIIERKPRWAWFVGGRILAKPRPILVSGVFTQEA